MASEKARSRTGNVKGRSRSHEWYGGNVQRRESGKQLVMQETRESIN